MRAFVLAFLVCCFSLVLPLSATAESCPVRVPRTLTDGDKALRNHNYKEAETLYRAELEKSPDSTSAQAGMTLALLYGDKPDGALRFIQDAAAKAPKDADLRALLGQAYFRMADLPNTISTLNDAMKLNACSPRVHYVLFLFDRANSMYASAYRQIDVAHQLDPHDPEIGSAWLEGQPASYRIAEFKKQLESKDPLPEQARADLAEHLDMLEKRAEFRKQHGECKLVSDVKQVTTPLALLMQDANRIRAYGLSVRLNDKATARLELDTGASGLYIGRSIAQHAGLEPIGKAHASGVGDDKDPTGYMAYADDIKIGQLEFKNCLVEVSDKRSVVDADGLIGGDVFSDYLVTIDYPMRTFSLGPLPLRPGDAPAKGGLDTAEESSKSTSTPENRATAAGAPVLHDRYIAPEMQDWTHVLRFGHQLLLPVSIGDQKPHMFLLDTGAFSTVVSPEVARTVSKVDKDYDTNVRGISGKVKDVYQANKMILRFGGLQHELDGLTLFDTHKISRSTGFEVSGILGHNTLRYLTISIDYRDGLVHMLYDKQHGSNIYSAR